MEVVSHIDDIIQSGRHFGDGEALEVPVRRRCRDGQGLVGPEEVPEEHQARGEVFAIVETALRDFGEDLCTRVLPINVDTVQVPFIGKIG